MSREFFRAWWDWPKGSAALTIREENRTRLRYGDIYKGICGADFLDGFQLTKVSRGRFLDILPNNLGWAIASTRCCECVLRVSTNSEVQCLPIKPLLLLPSLPSELAGYSLITTRTVLDCLELASPDLCWFDESQRLVKSFSKLPLSLSKIPADANLFCVKRLPAAYVVSGEMKDALTHMGITGWGFERCDTR